MDRFFRCPPSRIVHIVRDDDFLCVPRHDACLFGCDRRSERCHGIRHTGGMNGKPAEKTTNQSMNDLIRGVRTR